MLLEFLGLKESPIPDTTWIQVAKNVTTNEQMNNVILTFQINSFFELFLDISFIAIAFIISFGTISLLNKVPILKIFK